jgi:catechol 2,3-dioxygenase-like lactoylglutathione lyase family enzyme
MKYISTLIAVSDMERSKQFYNEILGLSVVNDFGANAELSGGIALQRMDIWREFIDNREVILKNNAGELYFETDDIDAFEQQLSGVELVHPVTKHNWGQRVVRFYDPDGHIIEVGENMDRVVLRFINSGLSVDETAVRMDVGVDYVRNAVERCK